MYCSYIKSNHVDCNYVKGNHEYMYIGIVYVVIRFIYCNHIYI